MKRYSIVITLVSVSMAFSGICFAQQQNTGCGLGSMAFENQTGLVQQVLAVTTNGSFGTQTFGITSGTSKCERPKSYVDNENINKFVSENMDSLAKDIARGSGEHLYALSVLMDIPQSEELSGTPACRGISPGSIPQPTSATWRSSRTLKP